MVETHDHRQDQDPHATQPKDAEGTAVLPLVVAPVVVIRQGHQGGSGQQQVGAQHHPETSTAHQHASAFAADDGNLALG
ncbi:MAG: hypothetical protein ACK5ZP_13880, partial [Betaproteobacteria bacterium]